MKLNSHGEMLLCQLLNKLDALLEKIPDADTAKVPTDLLREMCKILAGDGTMPGLEDYVSGNYRQD